MRVFPTILKNNIGITYPQLHETFRPKKTHVELYFNGVFYEMVHPNGQFPDPELRPAARPISVIEEADYTPRSPHYNYFRENLCKKFRAFISPYFLVRGQKAQQSTNFI